MHKYWWYILENPPLRSFLGDDIIKANGGGIMRDFPIFTTEYGVSSLTLKEIPYKSIAYIHVRDVQPGFFQEHMKECVSFCRMCGADAIFAAGHDGLEQCPLHMSVVEMRGSAQPDPPQVKCLFPVKRRSFNISSVCKSAVEEQ